MLTPVIKSLSETDSLGSLSKYNKLILDYLIHMGYWDLYTEYCKYLDLPTLNNPLFQRRSSIRSLIEEGKIDECKEELKSLDIEIVSYKEIFVNLTCHKAHEMKGKLDKVEIIKYLKANLGEMALEFEEEVEEILEYLIFNIREVEIKEKREELADFINEFLVTHFNVGENDLQKMIKEIVDEENLLSQKNRFVDFKERILENKHV